MELIKYPIKQGHERLANEYRPVVEVDGGEVIIDPNLHYIGRTLGGIPKFKKSDKMKAILNHCELVDGRYYGFIFYAKSEEM